jgi:hypothetical protein
MDEFVVAPVRTLLDALAIGEELTADLTPCVPLQPGIDGMFRTEVEQYPGWPSGSTTDGFVAALCSRSGPHSVRVVGMSLIDFADRRFPSLR